jgi:hypothetical protein
VGKGILALIQRIKTPVRMMQRMLISVRVRLYYSNAPFVFITKPVFIRILRPLTGNVLVYVGSYFASKLN